MDESLSSGPTSEVISAVREKNVWAGILWLFLFIVTLLVGSAFAQTTVSVSSPTSGATFGTGSNITLSAAVSPAAGTTITKVEFRRDGSNILIGTATAAPWQITWTNVSAGSYEVAAVAYDTAPNYTYSTPVPIQVGGPLVVQVASPAANSLIAAGSNVTITGSATRDGATAPITSMRFYRNGALLGTKTSAPWTWAWNNVTVGSYALEVRAYEASGSYTQSSPITVTVPALPLINWLAPANNSSVQIPNSVTLSAASNPGDTNTTIAKVDFLANGNVVATDTTVGANSSYSASWTPALAGTYTIVARATDSLGATKSTGSRTLNVLAGPTTVNVNSPTNNQHYNAPATIPLTAAVGGGGAVQSLAFYQGTTLIGQGAAQGNNVFSLSWASVPAGTYSVTAKSTSTTNVVTTSPAITVVVDSVQVQTGIYFVDADHLNTPRVVTNAAGVTVWKWDQAEPFGDTPPNEDPDGDNVQFQYNPRFPGQYYDKETNLSYNYFRDYDSNLGRYVESDPIGLAGGVNTYGYVAGSPLLWSDPSGLDITINLYPGASGQGHVGIGVNSPSTQGLYPVENAGSVNIISGQDVPGEVKPDAKPADGTITIKTSPQQDQALKDFIERTKKNPGNYNLYRRNCVAFVQQGLFSAGIASCPASIKPKEFFKDLRAGRCQ